MHFHRKLVGVPLLAVLLAGAIALLLRSAKPGSAPSLARDGATASERAADEEPRLPIAESCAVRGPTASTETDELAPSAVVDAPSLAIDDADATVSGTVRQPIGIGAPGARVSWAGGSLVADELGRFSFEAQADAIELEAHWQDMTTARAVPISLHPARAREGVELQLVQGGRLTGVVLDAQGEPEANAGVRMQRVSSGTRRTLRSDAAGGFDCGWLAPDRYTLSTGSGGAERTESVDLRAGDELHVLLGGHAASPILVLGTLMRAGEAVGGEVTAFPEGPRALQDAGRARVDQQGRFELSLAHAGAYVVLAEPSLGCATSFHVVVPDEPSSALHLELPTGSIAGSVIDELGQPVRGHWVSLRRKGESLLLARTGRDPVRTESDGRWSFQGLESGTYSVLATFDGADAGNPAMMRGARQDGVVLGVAEHLEPIVLELRPSHVLLCRVTDAGGRPVEDAQVFVRAAGGAWIFPDLPSRTATNGTAIVANLSPGHYTLTARTRDAITREGPMVEALSIELLEQHAPIIELALQPGAFLRASLTDAAGDPIHARFEVRDEHGREQTGTTCFHDEARLLEHGFRSSELWLGPLLPGPYTVTATGADGRRVAKEVVLHAGFEAEVGLMID